MISFRFVQDHQELFDVKRMCTLVEVPCSSFYACTTRRPTARERADTELLGVIVEIYEASRRHLWRASLACSASSSCAGSAPPDHGSLG